jgi:acyl-CoA synthetase (AMP-forming)/AMP-acid ligase II
MPPLPDHAPRARRPPDDPGGVLPEGWRGNRWFGNWLMDNCLAHPLHEGPGEALTTAPPGTGHVPRQAQRLGITARRVTDALFDTLTLIDDLPQDGGKIARAAAMRARLLAGRDPRPVPGVWLWRGRTGDQRIMPNEEEIANRLARDHGFLILDPTTMTVDALMDACGAARVVAEVEGSQPVHGQAVALAAALLPGGEADALMARCRRAMLPCMGPRHIHLRDGAMPRTASGKLDRPAIIVAARSAIEAPA